MKNPASDDKPKNGVQVYIPPKLASVILAVLIGTGAGSLGGLKLFNRSDGDKSSHNSTHMNRDEIFNVRFENIEKQQVEHTEKIAQLEETTQQIQDVQHQDIARAEARRVTKDLVNRRRRQEMEDRIYEVNLARLKKGEPPCLDRSCAN